jgi:hypothetical protein
VARWLRGVARPACADGGARGPDYTKARLDAGHGTLLDNEGAAALLAGDRTQLANARFGVVRLQEQLGILIGEDRRTHARFRPCPLGDTLRAGDDDEPDSIRSHSVDE